MRRPAVPAPASRRAKPLLLLCVALLCTTARAEILQVQILHRHGAREHLSKDANRPGQENGAALLPAGAKQLRDLGDLLRTRYLLEGSAHQLRGSTPNFTSALDALSVSSNLDRTLSSARALLDGLYPLSGALIPTRVFGAKENDIRLRGYTLCPAFAARVRAFTRSAAFRARERAHRALLARAARAVGEDAALANIFNVFDRHQLHRLGHTFGRDPILPDADWRALRALADWAESEKFRGVGPLVAGAQVGTMLRFARTMAEAASAPTAHRMIAYSAHYPTLFGVFAALRGAPAPAPPANAIPAFGAALIWELHDGSRVRMLWYDGDPDKPLRPLAFPVAGCSDAERGCPLSALVAALEKRRRVYYEPAPFCRACRTDPTTTTVCAAGARIGTVGDVTPSAQGGRGAQSCASRSGYTKAGAIGGVIGVILGILIVICLRCCNARRKRARELRMQMHMEDIAERAERPLEENVADDGPKMSSTMDTYILSESGNDISEFDSR